MNRYHRSIEKLQEGELLDLRIPRPFVRSVKGWSVSNNESRKQHGRGISRSARPHREFLVKISADGLLDALRTKIPFGSLWIQGSISECKAEVTGHASGGPV